MKSRRMKRAGLILHIQNMRNTYWVLVGKLEGKILIGRSKHRREFSSEMELKVIECSGMD
jgi:hypothetical protein